METLMTMRLPYKAMTAVSATLVVAAALAACGGDDDSAPAKGQASLEVYAELQQAGIGGITQMPDGQLIVGYHPFYQTATSTQVALLNADRKSTTPYPAGLRQTCRNADGSFVAPVGGRYDFCLDWVLGFHTDANGILWILDSVKSTDKADPVHPRPAALHAKLVGWNTKTNQLHKVIDLDSSTISQSQHNDFAIDLKHNVAVIADEAIGELANGVGDTAALVVVDLATGTSRRLLQGDPHVMPNADPIRWDAQGGVPAASWGLRVGVDGITLDKDQDYLYFGALSGYEMYRVHMTDLLNTSLTPAQLSAKIEFYARKPYNGGLTIDNNNNLYLTAVGTRAVGIIPADTKVYRDYVSDPNLIWPDGVTYNSDGYMYSGAAQLILTGTFQSNATPAGTAKNAAPYRVYRFRPETAGTPGS
jgi:sugar lactone lactonase YvrE